MAQTIDERLTKAEERILELEKENQDRLIPSVKEAGRRIILLEEGQESLVNELVSRINGEIRDAVREFQANIMEARQELNEEKQVVVGNIRKVVSDDLAQEAAEKAAQKVGRELVRLVPPAKLQPPAYVGPAQ